jgi:hypothetical protein
MFPLQLEEGDCCNVRGVVLRHVPRETQRSFNEMNRVEQKRLLRDLIEKSKRNNELIADPRTDKQPLILAAPCLGELRPAHASE